MRTPAWGAEARPNLFQEVISLKEWTRSIKRIACGTFKTVGEIFTPTRNSTYKAKELIKTFIEICTCF